MTIDLRPTKQQLLIGPEDDLFLALTFYEDEEQTTEADVSDWSGITCEIHASHDPDSDLLVTVNVDDANASSGRLELLATVDELDGEDPEPGVEVDERAWWFLRRTVDDHPLTVLSGAFYRSSRARATTPSDIAVALSDQPELVVVIAQGPPGVGGGGGGAPTNATYLVGSAHGSLSNEIIAGATPGGELGGTWASPTVDTVHSGSSHAATQAAAEATAAAALSAHVGDSDDAHDASAISFTPGGTVAATNVQDAIEEIASEAGGGGAPADATYLTTTAETGLTNEVVVGTTPGGELGGTWAAPTVDALHSGSTHAGTQAAAEANSAAALSSHEADTSTHGVTTVAGLTESQTFTNKTLTTPTIGSFANAQHSHQNAAGGGTLDGAAIGSGTVANARLDADLGAIGDLSTAGFVARTGSGTAAARTLQEGTGIDITNPAGTAGDPTIALDLSEVSAGGELGGTMDAPTVDATHSGSSHAAVQAAAEATAAAALSAHTSDTSDAHDASAVSFTPYGEIAGTDVQAALEDLEDLRAAGSDEDVEFYRGLAAIPPQDFLSTSATIGSGWSNDTANSATTNPTTSAGAQMANHPGIWSFNTGTTASGAAGASLGLAATGSNSMFDTDTKAFSVMWIFRIPVLSDATDTFIVDIGMGDEPAGSAFNDFIGVQYSHGINSGKFLYRYLNATVATTADSGLTVVANTWYRFKMVHNGSGATTFTIDSANSQTISSGIPTGPMGLNALIRRTSGSSNSRSLNLDLCVAKIACTR